MEVKQLDFSVNDAFVMSHPFGHHKKTSLWAQAQNEHIAYDRCLGFYKNNTLVASAMIFAKKNIFGQRWYIPFGPCVDYLDKNLTSEVMKSLHDYAMANHVALVQFEVNVPRIEHDKNGEIIPDGFNHEAVTQTLIASGFDHMGYTYGYSGNIQPRFTYILDLSDDMEVLQKNMHKSLIADQKKNIRRHITVKEEDASKLNTLVIFGEELSDENDFSAKDLNHFKQIMDVYQDHALYLVASMDLVTVFDTIDHEIKLAQNEIAKYSNNPKKARYLEEIISQVAALNNEKNLLANLYPNQEKVDLGAGLFVSMGNCSYDLYMYSSKQLTKLSPTIAIHLKAMEIFKDRGVKHYDFVGISGSILPSDPYYGLYDFKRKFGGDFIEYIGQFEAYLKPLQAKLILKTHFQKRRIERKLIRISKQIKRKKNL